MPAGIVPFNAANPFCLVNQCLKQVVGSLDNNPVAQTLPGGAAMSTTTETVSYTDIIVTLEVTETVTEYSSTSVATVTETVVAPHSTVVARKRGHKKRGCQRTTTTASISIPATTTTPVTRTSAADLNPIASNCADRDEYSSACSCVYAAGDIVVTVTDTIPEETYVVTVTENTAVPSTSTSVVTVVVTSTTVVPATTTITSTTTGLYQTTTTVTTTTTPIPPTQTAYLAFDWGARQYQLTFANGRSLIINYDGSAPQPFGLVTAGGQPWFADRPQYKLYARVLAATNGVLEAKREADAALEPNRYHAVTCSVDYSGDVSCAVPSRPGLTVLYQCGAYLYLGLASWRQSGCAAVSLKMSF